MSKDITNVLSGWEYDPDELQVRIVAGDDGREKIQMRLDLGLIQVEMAGRPDGGRPEGYESLLEAYEARAKAAERQGESFKLDSKACADLLREGYQYYHRYLAAFHLQRYDVVSRDTDRNLRLFAFVVRHAARRRDRLEFDQYRPYVLMMRGRARAHLALARRDYDGALAAVDEGIVHIREFLKEYGQAEDETVCSELAFLLRFRRELEEERPVGPVERLERQLAMAVENEDYEEAAKLRDQLSRLKGLTPAGRARPG
ncbi:MAG: UvrB/UvrC motif-containing protein [Isosphaeraceae bacterium]